LPLAVILIVPVCICAALFGVWLAGGDNNVFVQVGLVVLMGLACKNAILIVEFCRWPSSSSCPCASARRCSASGWPAATTTSSCK
ncbi:hypothetical protein CQA09_29175, partial [Klebsiella pneumoniae]